MNVQEWVDLGVQNGLVTVSPPQELTFEQVYEKWFVMKLKTIKPQSCDRIECCYNRYYAGSWFAAANVSSMDEIMVSRFLTELIVGRGGIGIKEYRRIYQVANNVLVYAKDLKLGGMRLLDWDIIKRYIPEGKYVPNIICKFAVPRSDVCKMMDLVIHQKIYPLKQSACLCLMLNFFLGLRVGELASLTWRDVDFDAGLLRVYKTEVKFYPRDENGKKNGTMAYHVMEDTKTFYSVRPLPLVPEAVFILKQLKEHHVLRSYDSPYLAYDGSQTVLSRSLDRTLRRLCDLCEVNRFNTHDIRKTFATMLHDSGMPTRYLSDLLGHSDMITTERYYILRYKDNYDTLREYMRKGLYFRPPD